MAFTFAARTLLELGKELISTDEVAIYELIKNGVDAQYEKDFELRNVGIRCHVVLLRSDYDEALRKLEGRAKTGDVLAFLEGRLIDADRAGHADRFLDSLRPTIGKRAAFTETLRRAYASENWLEITDPGTGMSLEDLTTVYLHIGTRSRRAKNLEGATYLGDKGVGRLSAMRIGDMLRVTTTRAGDVRQHVLEIDWSDFAHDSDKRADEVRVVPVDGDVKDDRQASGTAVRILNLNADWSKARFQEILQGRVARMVDPFQKGRANRLIAAEYNGSAITVPSIPKELLDAAHATLNATFRFEDETPVLDGTIDYKLRHRSRRIDVRGAEIYSLSQQTAKRRGKKGHAAVKLVELSPGALEKLGPFSIDLYWYNRLVVRSVEKLSDGTMQTRQRIAEWAGGPMLYRHDFRVLPYGDKDDDWLALDEGAFRESGFKLNRQQVIGRVSISSPHTSMSEQTNREGLVESEAAEALKSILRWLIHIEMKDLIKEADVVEKLAKRDAQEDATQLKTRRAHVEEALHDLRAVAGPSSEDKIRRLSREVASLTAHASSLVERLDRVVAEAEDEREKFVYLAGVGLMTEFIFHELDRAVSHTLSELTRASRTGGTALLDSLADQLGTLHKRIAAFDEMTGEKRQTKTNFDLAALIASILETHSNEFARHSVVVDFERSGSPFMVRAVRGMVIQIVENLITNALYWLKQQSAFETRFSPKLWIALDSAGRTLSVEDNGPGVAADRKERIFQPFVTSKPAGQGRGLGLFISRELAEYHGWRLAMDGTTGRQRTDRTNMFVLTME